MKIIEYTPNQFNKIEGIWKSFENGTDMTVFQSYEWYCWLNTAYEKERVKNIFRKWIYFVCFDDDEKPLLIAPIQIVSFGKKIKGIGVEKAAYIIGRKKYTDYMNFIYKDFDKDAFDYLLTYINNQYRIEKFIFEYVLENTALSDYIIYKFNLAGFVTYSSAALTLPETFEDYTGRLKKHAKQNIRTAINRQKRDSLNLYHEVTYLIDNDLKDTLLDIRKQRLKEKDKKSIKKISSKVYNWLLKNIVRRFDANIDIFDAINSQWAFLVKDNDKIVGFYWGVVDRQKSHYYVIYAGVDKEYAWYSPSLSHLYKWIEELYIENNTEIRVIDFTIGNERYKTDIGGKERNIQNLEFSI